jgi:hypothetical protein
MFSSHQNNSLRESLTNGMAPAVQQKFYYTHLMTFYKDDIFPCLLRFNIFSTTRKVTVFTYSRGRCRVLLGVQYKDGSISFLLRLHHGRRTKRNKRVNLVVEDLPRTLSVLECIPRGKRFCFCISCTADAPLFR